MSTQNKRIPRPIKCQGVNKDSQIIRNLQTVDEGEGKPRSGAILTGVVEGGGIIC
jgi:hypothetical protein